MRGASAADRYGLAILSILVNYVLAAALRGEVGSAWATASALVTIWLVFTVSQAPRARRTAQVALVVAVVVALVVTVARMGQEDTPLQGFLLLANLVLYLVAPIVIVRHIFRRPRIDTQTLNGAVAAYLLIGMAFAYAYSLVAIAQPMPPLFGDSGRGDMQDYLFFSFITLTTTGYGNLVPAGNPAQTLAVAEAILGQLFLVTAVARIVSAWRMPAELQDRDADQPAAGD